MYMYNFLVIRTRNIDWTITKMISYLGWLINVAGSLSPYWNNGYVLYCLELSGFTGSSLFWEYDL